jgi:hypothetical protein
VAEPAHRDTGILRLEWRAVAIVLGILLVIVLATLVVVSEEQTALATVALALAILAFVLQILMFIVQSLGANQQMLQNQDLYGRMQETLAGITERTGRTERVVERLDERIVTVALEKSFGQAQLREGPMARIDTGEVIATVRQALDAARTEAEEQVATGVPAYPRRPRSAEDRQVVELLTTWPSDEEGLDAIKQIRELHEESRYSLLIFGNDEIMVRQPGSSLAPGFFSFSPELAQKELVTTAEPTVRNADGMPLMVLSDKGRAVVRVLTAEGEPPPALAEAGIHELRRELEEFDMARPEPADDE